MAEKVVQTCSKLNGFSQKALGLRHFKEVFPFEPLSYQRVGTECFWNHKDFFIYIYLYIPTQITCTFVLLETNQGLNKKRKPPSASNIHTQGILFLNNGKLAPQAAKYSG